MKGCDGPFGTTACPSLPISSMHVRQHWEAERQLIFVFKIQVAIDFLQMEALHLMNAAMLLEMHTPGSRAVGKGCLLLFLSISNSQQKPK